jgi:hypothetical protein
VALSKEQLRKYESIKNEINAYFSSKPKKKLSSSLEKALDSIGKSYGFTGMPSISYHGLADDVLRVSVAISALSQDSDKKAITNILKKHKMKKIRSYKEAARGGKLVFDAVDK